MYLCTRYDLPRFPLEQRTRGGLRVLIMVKEPYQKRPLSIYEQVLKLKHRGMIFDDEKTAMDYLSNISYYRLRAYTYPFQDNTNPQNDHHFIRNGIHFHDIINLYRYDRQLRILVFNIMEKIEVAIRTKLTQLYSENKNDSHWFCNPDCYKNEESFQIIQKQIKEDVDRSNEDFIKHYKTKYSTPDMPPSWMTLEVVSLGTLSRLYKSLKKDKTKRAFAEQFGINDVEIMANWLHALSNLRNCCAHHSRIWNRRFMVQLTMPYNTIHPFINKEYLEKIKQNKLFALLSCMKYICDIISPNNELKTKLKQLNSQGGVLLSLRDMGFPYNWEESPVWQKN